MAGRGTLDILNIVLFNTHGADPKVTAHTRHENIKIVLDTLQREYTNLFIFCQDTITKTKHNLICDKLQTYIDFDKLGHSTKIEAVIYYWNLQGLSPPRYIEPEELENALTLVEGCQDFTPDRLMACVVKSSYAKLLLVSWHGPHRRDRDAKRSCFRKLYKFCASLRAQQKCDFVIMGGDFNIKFSEIEDLCRQWNLGHEFLRESSKDFIVFWSFSDLPEIITVEPPRECTPQQVKELVEKPFDHLIISNTLAFNVPRLIPLRQNKIYRNHIIKLTSRLQTQYDTLCQLLKQTKDTLKEVTTEWEDGMDVVFGSNYNKGDLNPKVRKENEVFRQCLKSLTDGNNGVQSKLAGQLPIVKRLEDCFDAMLDFEAPSAAGSPGSATDTSSPSSV